MQIVPNSRRPVSLIGRFLKVSCCSIQHMALMKQFRLLNFLNSVKNRSHNVVQKVPMFDRSEKSKIHRKSVGNVNPAEIFIFMVHYDKMFFSNRMINRCSGLNLILRHSKFSTTPYKKLNNDACIPYVRYCTETFTG